MYDELDEEKSAKNGPIKGGFASRLRRAPKWAYRKLASLRTSVYLLLASAFFYFIGAIFPQGGKFEDYVKAKGGAQWLVSAFDLLDFFASPLFLILASILFLNLVICSYERYASLFANRRYPKPFKPTYTMPLTLNASEAHEAVQAVFKRLGFRQASKDSLWTVMEKGLSYRWLTWLYHAGIILCFLGATLTFLFAYEDSITLWPDKPAQIKAETDGRLQKIISLKPAPIDWQIVLDEFSSVYAQKPRLVYPDDGVSRLAVGLGWLDLKYQNVDDMYAPKAWRSKVRIVKGGALTLQDATVEVNRPLRYDGYTFYQEGYEQKVRVRVDDNPITLLAKAGEELIVPGMDETIKFEDIKTGAIDRINNTSDRIKITAKVKVLTKDRKGEVTSNDYGTVELGEGFTIGGRSISFIDLIEGTTLSYRFDPGAQLMWYSGIFVLVTMALRFYGRTCFAAYNIEDHGGIVILDLYIEAKGFIANPDRIYESLDSLLSADAIPIDPIPDVKFEKDDQEQ